MYFKKQFRLILIISLFILGVVLSLLTYPEKFSILSFSHNRNNFSNFQNTELLKGQTIKGEFVAKENNLGIVALRFNTYGRINKDSVIFRIKQKNADSWYYQNKYKADQFQPNDFFTFGFPIMDDSKGKAYQFEIESLYGRNGEAVGLSMMEPSFLTKYQFSNTKFSLDYIAKKIMNSFSDSKFIFHAILYFIPLCFYILFLLLNLKFISRSYILLALNFLVIVFDIFDVVNLHDNGAVIFLILGFLVIQFRFYKISSKVLFFIVFLFLLFVPLLLFLNNAIIAERLAKWAILLSFVALAIEISNVNIFLKNLNF